VATNPTAFAIIIVKLIAPLYHRNTDIRAKIQAIIALLTNATGKTPCHFL
jgi:hypothetical protein